MSRSSPWRRKAPYVVQQTMQLALDSRFFVVREAGPTAFVLKGNSAKTFHVQIGDRQQCSCKTSPELCVHILFVMLRIFRIPFGNPIVWQLSLSDDEISQILSGRLQRQQQLGTSDSKEKSSNSCVRKPISDVCPICYEEMKEKSELLVFCQRGCGNNMHAACMQVWATHHKNTSTLLTCPLCRKEWGPLIIPPNSSLKSDTSQRKANMHSVPCDNCGRKKIVGPLFACVQCVSYNICQVCYNDPFVHAKHSNFRWCAKEGSPFEVGSPPGRGSAGGPVIVGLPLRGTSSSATSPLLNIRSNPINSTLSISHVANQNVASRPSLRSEEDEHLISLHHPLQASSEAATPNISSSIPSSLAIQSFSGQSAHWHSSFFDGQAHNSQPEHEEFDEQEIENSAESSSAGNLSSGLPSSAMQTLMFRDIDPDDYEVLLGLDVSVAPKRVLAEEIVATLPVVSFCASSNMSSVAVTTSSAQSSSFIDNNATACSICLVDILNGEKVTQLPQCGHLFHPNCIKQWLTNHKDTCPIDGSLVEEYYGHLIDESLHFSDVDLTSQIALIQEKESEEDVKTDESFLNDFTVSDDCIVNEEDFINMQEVRCFSSPSEVTSTHVGLSSALQVDSLNPVGSSRSAKSPFPVHITDTFSSQNRSEHDRKQKDISSVQRKRASSFNLNRHRSAPSSSNESVSLSNLMVVAPFLTHIGSSRSSVLSTETNSKEVHASEAEINIRQVGSMRRRNSAIQGALRKGHTMQIVSSRLLRNHDQVVPITGKHYLQSSSAQSTANILSIQQTFPPDFACSTNRMPFL